jgi:hypothetical protein
VSMPIHTHYKGTTIQWVVFESTRVPPTVMSTMLQPIRSGCPVHGDERY